MERSIDWDSGAIVTLDQTVLPHEYRALRLTTVDQVVEAIGRLAIRGAPALGVAGALGVALSARNHLRPGRNGPEAVLADAERISSARPTAVNLRWGVRRAVSRLDEGAEAVLAEAVGMLAEDERTNEAAARRAAELVRALCPAKEIRILTHCNTGRLATVAHGTALGAIKELATSGDLKDVLAGETRPLLQGARLTAWELAEAGIAYRVCVDSAGPAAMAAGLVDCVLVGADRIAANGDVANKIGTYSLAVAAARNGIPFVVVAPESTIDVGTARGADIAIEQRADEEVTTFAGRQVTPADTAAFNPAFDVTPADLVTAIVTESRVIRADDRLPEQIRSNLTAFADFPSPGILFQDLAGVYRDPELVGALTNRIVSTFAGRFDCVLAIEARGFPLGAAISQRARTPLVLARKPGKLPGRVRTVRYGLEYGTDELQVQLDGIPTKARVLIVDDVLATGGTAHAAAELVERGDATVTGIAVLVEIMGAGGRERLDGRELHTGCQVGATR